MTERLFGRGRSGGVLLIAGAVLGAVVVGPGRDHRAEGHESDHDHRRQALRQARRDPRRPARPRRRPLTTFTTADASRRSRRRRSRRPARASWSCTARCRRRTTRRHRCCAAASCSTGSRSGTTPLSTTPASFELFLRPTAADEPRENGAVERRLQGRPARDRSTVQLAGPGRRRRPRCSTSSAAASPRQFVPKGKAATDEGRQEEAGRAVAARSVRSRTDAADASGRDSGGGESSGAPASAGALAFRVDPPTRALWLTARPHGLRADRRAAAAARHRPRLRPPGGRAGRRGARPRPRPSPTSWSRRWASSG